MADFAKPTILSEYNTLLDEFKSSIASVARMFDGTVDTNIPVGSIKYNSGTSRIEKWDGTQWVPQLIAGVAANGVSGASLQADSIGADKILLANTQYLRGQGSTGTANLLRINNTTTELNAPAGGELAFTIGGQNRWKIDAVGLRPNAPDTFGLGGSARLTFVNAQLLRGVEEVRADGANLVIGTLSNNDVVLKRLSAERWALTGTGLMPLGNDTESIGEAGRRVGTAAIRTITLCDTVLGIGDVEHGTSSGTNRFALRAGSNYWDITSGSNAALYPRANGTQDLGGLANMIRNAYIQQIVNPLKITASTAPLVIETSTAQEIIIRTNNQNRWRFGATGALVPSAPSVFNVGDVAMPVNDFVGKRFINSGFTAVFGTVTNDIAQIVQNGSVKLSFETDGRLNLWGQEVLSGATTDSGRWLKIHVNGEYFWVKLFK